MWLKFTGCDRGSFSGGLLPFLPVCCRDRTERVSVVRIKDDYGKSKSMFMYNSIVLDNNGRVVINPANVFVNMVREMPLGYEDSLSDYLLHIKQCVLREAKKQGYTISDGAFNKCNGDWYEWIIAIGAIDFFRRNGTKKLLVGLPNKSSFNLIDLYKPELNYYLSDLADKLKLNKVNLVTSNPDFVILDVSSYGEILMDKLLDVSFSQIDVSTINVIDSLYKLFIGYADIDSIYGYLSVKTTFRPDRRLQLAHEGSLIKALYAHLQTRTWTISSNTVRYYGAATHIGFSDADALQTVATHSITDVKSLPQRAVDDLFRINSLIELERCLSQIMF